MPSTMDRVSAAIGRGLLAGVVGTAAMTVSSTLEAKASGRGSSTTPADAVGVVAGAIAFATDTLHHSVYAAVTGLAYDYLSRH